MTKPSLELLDQIEHIQRGVAHRPFHPDTPSHQEFIHKQLEKIDALQHQHPWMNWDEERRQLQALIG